MHSPFLRVCALGKIVATLSIAGNHSTVLRGGVITADGANNDAIRTGAAAAVGSRFLEKRCIIRKEESPQDYELYLNI